MTIATVGLIGFGFNVLATIVVAVVFWRLRLKRIEGAYSLAQSAICQASQTNQRIDTLVADLQRIFERLASVETWLRANEGCVRHSADRLDALFHEVNRLSAIVGEFDQAGPTLANRVDELEMKFIDAKGILDGDGLEFDRLRPRLDRAEQFAQAAQDNAVNALGRLNSLEARIEEIGKLAETADGWLTSRLDTLAGAGRVVASYAVRRAVYDARGPEPSAGHAELVRKLRESSDACSRTGFYVTANRCAEAADAIEALTK